MKKLNIVLENILYQRYYSRILNEQSGAVSELLPAVRGGLRGGVRRVKPSQPEWSYPKPKPSEFLPPPPKANWMQSADDWKVIVDNDINVALSKTTNPEEIYQQTLNLNTGALLSDPDVGAQVAEYAAIKIKERLGQVPEPELEPIVVPIPQPAPYTPPALPKPAMDIEDFGSQKLSYTGIPSTEVSPMEVTATALEPTLDPVTKTQYSFLLPTLLKTATRARKPKEEEKDEYENEEDSAEGFNFDNRPVKSDIAGTDKDIDVDLEQTKLGKYSGSYRVK